MILKMDGNDGRICRGEGLDIRVRCANPCQLSNPSPLQHKSTTKHQSRIPSPLQHKFSLNHHSWRIAPLRHNYTNNPIMVNPS
ncbi:MAG: hypothetical protein CVU41_09720 [Chloroflexi bacterium HGW-Chloroflexi-3]|nr:MAG: hypothetical protein CVU41_09720 [Chloroflexi bacterium HGW-Chloroflexi-3]